MELEAEDRVTAMAECHDDFVVGPCVDAQVGWKRVRRDAQRVVAAHREAFG